MSPSILYVGFIFLAHALKLLCTARPILTFGQFTKAFAHVNGITGETAGLAVDVQNYLHSVGLPPSGFRLSKLMRQDLLCGKAKTTIIETGLAEMKMSQVSGPGVIRTLL